MKTVLSTIILLIVHLTAFSQYQLVGSVKDQNGEILPFATVMLLNSANELVKGEVADAGGSFVVVDIDSGEYLISITSVGYEGFQKSLTLTTDHDLQDIILEETSELLEEIVVSASRPAYVKKPDRAIVNVSSLPSAAGGNLLELIEKSPSVQIDRVSGNVSLLGRDGVVIAINGKVNRLEGNDLLQYLASLPSDNIESIELINNPPASFDAEGNGGVVNIIIKNYDGEGLNGRVNSFVGYGERGKYGASFNFNYQKGKTNIYGDGATSQDYTNQNSDIYSSIDFEDGTLTSDQRGERPAFLGNHQLKLGLNQQLLKKTSIDVFGAYSQRQWTLESLTNSTYSGDQLSIARDELRGSETNSTHQYTLSSLLSHVLSEGHEISASYDYLAFQNVNPTNYNLRNFDFNNDEISSDVFRSRKETPYTFHVVRTDYRGNIKNGLAFETGVKATISNVENRTQLLDENGVAIEDGLFTDAMTLDESIYAAYASLNGHLGNEISFNAGVRYEYSELELVSALGNVDRNLSRFFPTVNLSRKIQEETSIALSYRERIDRPGFQSLAPSFFFFNPFTVYTGNIQALPNTSKTIESTFNHQGMALSISYSSGKNPLSFAQPLVDQERSLLLLRADNINSRSQWGLNLSFPIDFTTFWTSTYNFGAYHRIDEVRLQEVMLSESNTFYNVNISQRLQLRKGWSFEVNGAWNSEFYVGTIRQPARTTFNLGLEKEFGNNARLGFSWTDMFDNGSYLGLRNNLENQGLFYDWEYEFEGNIFRLSFSVPLNGKQSKSSRNSNATEILRRAAG